MDEQEEKDFQYKMETAHKIFHRLLDPSLFHSFILSLNKQNSKIFPSSRHPPDVHTTQERAQQSLALTKEWYRVYQKVPSSSRKIKNTTSS